MKPRARIASCYDHLSGLAGERLTKRLLDLGWVTPEPTPGVTPGGWQGFQELGLSLLPLTASRRKPVAYCTEIRRDGHHDHLGGHLGALVRHHFLARGWLAMLEGRLELTAEGEQVLRQLGVDLEDEL